MTQETSTINTFERELQHEVSTTIQEETHSSTEHSGPHIPGMQGEYVWWAVSNVTITTFIFLIGVIIVSLFAKKGLRSEKKSKLVLFFLTFVKFFDDQLRDAFGDKNKARVYYPLIVGIFFIILFGNLLGLIIDWFGMSIMPGILTYLRPMHSDLNTTLVLSLITVVLMLGIQIRTQGLLGTGKSYAFNWSGHSVGEKIVNVFVGWLHFVGIFSTLGSLSLRLFGNIFAGIVLIGVISFLTAMATSSFFEVGRIFAIPFWFFEVFVALIQAIVFAFLMIAYFKSAAEHHH